MAINWSNVFTSLRDLGAGVGVVAASIATAPAGTFDPKVTSAALAVTAISGSIAGLSHLGKAAADPTTFPQTPIVTPSAAQDLAKAVEVAGAESTK